MKKLLFFSVLFSGLNFYAQRNVSNLENEAGLVYSLPATELCIKIELVKNSRKPGRCFQYANRYLAATDVITEESSSYHLKQISLTSSAVADVKRSFIVPAHKKNTPRISLNEDGIICGINIPYEHTETKRTTKEQQPKKEEEYYKTEKLPNLLPLDEESLLRSSTERIAAEIAKLIYNIRETRQNLLMGDVESFPPDGKSLKLMLDGLNQQEQELTKVFVGTNNFESETHYIYLTPSTPLKNEILFRISTRSGRVASDNLRGTAYYISLSPEIVETEKREEISDKTALYFILPSKTKVEISDGEQVLFESKVTMPQFGKLIPIPKELLQDKNTRIFFDEKTGRIKRIE